MIAIDDFIRINNDVNGNPRYLIHFLKCVTDLERTKELRNNNNSKPFDVLYEIALKRVKKIVGGKKYRSKTFSGCIVVQSYDLHSVVKFLNQELSKY